MPLIVFIVTFAFLITAFITNATIETPSIFFAYILNTISFLIGNLIITALGLLLLIFSVRTYLARAEIGKFNFKVLIGKTAQVLLVGFLLSFVLLFVVAFLELNIFSFTANLNPAALGVTSDIDDISKVLRDSDHPPNVVFLGEGRIVAGIAVAESGDSNFYGKYIIRAIPSFLIFPSRFHSTTVLVNDTLIILGFNSSDIQKISPYLGFLTIKNYFPSRFIKFFPKVSVMNEHEYTSYRKKDANSKAAGINDEIRKTQDLASSISAAIEEGQRKIGEDTQTVNQMALEKNSKYKSCTSEGEYKSGIYVHFFTKEECRKAADASQILIDSKNSEIEALKRQIIGDQKQLAQSREFLDFLKTQVKVAGVVRENISNELGVFEPKASIRIMLRSKDENVAIDFLETLAHEYLHYASYAPGKNLEDSFFEEGLTEYFAQKALENALHKNVNLGYPVQTKIINEIVKSIPESDLSDIYFTKDQARLEELIDRVFGKEFYKKNRMLFVGLQYATNSDQALKFANGILKNMGAPLLTKQNLLSGSSSGR